MGVGRDQLRAFVERIERLEEEQRAINADKSEVYKEAKGNGFDVKVMRKIIADRRKDTNERAEFDAVYDMYADALGMDYATRAPARESTTQNASVPEGYNTETGEEVTTSETGEITEPVLMQEPHADADVHGGVSEHGREEGSQSRLPSDPVENKADGPSVIAAAPIPEQSNVFEIKRKSLRPNCLKPERCGAMGAEHCWTCTKAMQQSQSGGAA